MKTETKQIILFPTGTLPPETAALAESAGYVAIEVPDPSAVVMLMPSTSLLSGDALCIAALQAIDESQYDGCKERLGKKIIEAVLRPAAIAKATTPSES